MAFNRATLPVQLERLLTDLESRIPGADPRLPAHILNAISNAYVGAINELHGHLDYNALQVVPDSADDEHLLRYGNWRGIAKKIAAPSVGFVDMTGTDGAEIPALTVLQRSDGNQVQADSAVTISGGTASVPVTALSTGQITNANAGVSFSLVSPISGVNGSGVVDANGLTGGADLELVEPYRDRIRDLDRSPPHGGNVHDYVHWALEVAGVTRAWSMSNWLGLGTVGVFFVRDNDVDLIPDAAEVLAVNDYIETLRPAGMASLSVIAPVKLLQNMTIQIKPNTTDVQTAVTADLDDLFLRQAQVEDGNGQGIVPLNDVRDAIQHSTGITGYKVVSPTVDIAPATGNIAQRGTITWQTLP